MESELEVNTKQEWVKKHVIKSQEAKDYLTKEFGVTVT
jgi:hypothetical protein